MGTQVMTTKLLHLGVAFVYAGAVVLPARLSRAAEGQLPVDYTDAVRKNISLVLIASTKKKFGDEPLGTINRYANNALKAKTNLEAQLFGEKTQEQEHECDDPKVSYKLTCYVKAVRSDYSINVDAFHQEDNHAAPLRHWREVQEILDRNPNKPTKFLAVISAVYQTDGSLRLIPILIDTDAALERIHAANEQHKTTSESDQEALEQSIAQSSVRATPAPKTLKNKGESRDMAGDMENAIRAIFLEDFRQVFEEAGYWEPYGRIELAVAQAGLEIEIDGKKIGATKPGGKTVIDQVTSGERTVRLWSPLFLESKKPVNVERGGSARVEFVVQPLPNEVNRTTRKIVFWGGVLATAAGAAITTVGIVSAANTQGRTVLCFVGGPQAPTGCGSKEFIKFNMQTNLTTDPTKNAGLPIAPLGYAIGGLGLTWAASTLFLNDEDTFPWMEGLAGLIIGGTALVLSVVLDGKNGMKCNPPGHCQ
jgi:hypothetical protein